MGIAVGRGRSRRGHGRRRLVSRRRRDGASGLVVAEHRARTRRRPRRGDDAVDRRTATTSGGVPVVPPTTTTSPVPATTAKLPPPPRRRPAAARRSWSAWSTTRSRSRIRSPRAAAVGSPGARASTPSSLTAGWAPGLTAPRRAEPASASTTSPSVAKQKHMRLFLVVWNGLGRNTPRTARAARAVRPVRGRARAQGALRLRRDRRQRAEPEHVLDTAVRARAGATSPPRRTRTCSPAATTRSRTSRPRCG